MTSRDTEPPTDRATAPTFLLVPQVKLPNRFDLAQDAERVHQRCLV